MVIPLGPWVLIRQPSLLLDIDGDIWPFRGSVNVTFSDIRWGLLINLRQLEATENIYSFYLFIFPLSARWSNQKLGVQMPPDPALTPFRRLIDIHCLV